MRSLLVVVDMQNDFITGSIGSENCQAVVPNVINKIRSCVEDDYDVVFTMDTHSCDYLSTLEGKYLPIRHCIDGTTGWFLELNIEKELHNAILGSDSSESIYCSDACFKKSGFGSVDLGTFIRDNNYERVTLIGVCTDICVLSNALLIKSFTQDVLIEVDSSCCAGTSTESHNRALEAMKVCQISVV